MESNGMEFGTRMDYGLEYHIGSFLSHGNVGKAAGRSCNQLLYDTDTHRNDDFRFGSVNFCRNITK